ncbi:hypothetical protein BJV78DRAFT_1186934, partial [Lactifluus subvellereus]
MLPYPFCCPQPHVEGRFLGVLFFFSLLWRLSSSSPLVQSGLITLMCGQCSWLVFCLPSSALTCTSCCFPIKFAM